MAVVRINMVDGTGYAEYQCLNTDLEASYPVNCGAGSILEIIDQENKVVVGYKVFNGVTWNSL